MNSFADLPAAAWNAPWTLWQSAAEYAIDAWQRQILFLDVLRQRGNQYHEHMAEKAPNVLHFSAQVVLDGNRLPRPVNYMLSRIVPAGGIEIDGRKRPFIIIDPRAGHGPGIGGFKADSEIGVALKAGHPCYFVGFLPRPEPGQTVEDVMRAEVAFVSHVVGLHPEAEGLPVVIGNCQAGWQLLMAAATHPESFGPLLVAGTPLSFWAGERGRNPMRYSGGMLGGTWLTAWASDIGNGLFDGAWLVQNFENLNPANTLWTKQYNVYSKVDTEPPRFLEFEKYWGGYVLLNEPEIQYITDNLFVGNRLATAELVTQDGLRIDLRNIRSPIIVFCSRGDNISPPPQALGWILDLYESVDDIRAHGQTIIYAQHDSIGHLGIFVSGKVARKEHEEFASNIDFIDVLPPGLYEAVIVDHRESTPQGSPYILRFAARDIEDLVAIVQPSQRDDRSFAAVSRLSEINLTLYRNLMQPWLLAVMTEEAAETIRLMHPLRLKHELLSDANPLFAGLPDMAARVREGRRPASPDNPFLVLEHQVSDQIETLLDQWRDARDNIVELTFLSVFGNPVLQALFGLGTPEAPVRRRPGQDPERRAFVARQVTELRNAVAEGGLFEALLRALVFVGLKEGLADERTFNMLRRLHDAHGKNLTLQPFKETLRRQFFLIMLDEDAALKTMPDLLHEASASEIEAGLSGLVAISEASGGLSSMGRTRLRQIEDMFRRASRAASLADLTGSAAPVTTTTTSVPAVTTAPDVPSDSSTPSGAAPSVAPSVPAAPSPAPAAKVVPARPSGRKGNGR
ncbi:DUF3141 domain-containing protein [Pseudoroseomonas ludipueritiae]|uniref:DUF3141 domain-containing protein n=1 Tax=Pseudoroseomonas ludipueritiae TaxID=198093 RepID=A0ABR7R500_9PROT|nr:DUF3141 domain-containing protein [Pseudoroseomonas ludipueritiae]MBC9176824.1 DUF3141 domain-containing protein [Pseudoroseomonas ludipueritiae]